MVSNYFGKITLQFFRENSFITREGSISLGISEAANKSWILKLFQQITY